MVAQIRFSKQTDQEILVLQLASGGLGNVSEDTTPQLGGDLDVDGNAIVSTSNGNIVTLMIGKVVMMASVILQQTVLTEKLL